MENDIFKDMTKIICCLNCRQETDSWSWMLDFKKNRQYGICDTCIDNFEEGEF